MVPKIIHMTHGKLLVHNEEYRRTFHCNSPEISGIIKQPNSGKNLHDKEKDHLIHQNEKTQMR